MLRRLDGTCRVIGTSVWRAGLALLTPRRLPVLVALVTAALLLDVAPAGAVVVVGKSPGRLPSRVNTNTQLVLTRLGSGTSVTGFIANADNPFDPVKNGYPTSDPSTGFSPKDEGFAGVIHAEPPGGGNELSLYCIDILTNTYIGYGYFLGTWDAANVPNVGYVARLLNEYYPNTGEPATLTNLDQRAAAVQAAIWFFSDRYVLSTSDPLHAVVANIADHVISEGPLVEPPPPSLTLTPSQVSGPAGSVLGPFTLNTNAGARRHRSRHRAALEATVTATGGAMFSDAAATMPIPDGATLPSGQKIWVRSTGPIDGSHSGDRESHRTVGQRLPLRRQRRSQRRTEADPCPDGDLDHDGPGDSRVSGPRIAGGDQDDRRPGGRIAGARGPRCRLQRRCVPAAVRHTRGRACRPSVAYLRQHPRRNGVYRHRDFERERRRC